MRNAVVVLCEVPPKLKQAGNLKQKQNKSGDWVTGYLRFMILQGKNRETCYLRSYLLPNLIVEKDHSKMGLDVRHDFSGGKGTGLFSIPNFLRQHLSQFRAHCGSSAKYWKA